MAMEKETGDEVYIRDADGKLVAVFDDGDLVYCVATGEDYVPEDDVDESVVIDNELLRYAAEVAEMRAFG